MKIKFIICILIVVCIAFCLSIKAQAYSIENIFSDAQNFLKAGNSVDETINQAALKDTSNFIYKLLLAIGVIVAFIVGVVLGIQFMVSSAEDKAKVKEALVAYAISCVVLFGAYGIWSLVVNMAQDVVGEQGTTWASKGNDDCVHEWTTTTSSMHHAYVCKNCKASVVDREYGKFCPKTGKLHDWSITYKGSHNDIVLTCRDCNEKRSNNSEYSKTP